MFIDICDTCGRERGPRENEDVPVGRWKDLRICDYCAASFYAVIHAQAELLRRQSAVTPAVMPTQQSLFQRWLGVLPALLRRVS